MTWQNGRRLTSLQQGSNSISYKYNSNGVRTSKTVNGVEYTYEYLGGLLMHETRGDKTFDYCYDASGQLYAVYYKATATAAPETYYFSHNWRGDIIGIYNTQGTLVVSYEYDAWGNVISVADSNGNSINNDNHIANLNPFRYRGYYYDSETGLYYLMSRYYDPVTHRFVNADGYFQSGGNILDTNMNAYCRNNPVMYSDPNGKHTECGAPNCRICRKEYRDFINANVDWYNRVTGENILGVDSSGNFVYPAKIEIDKESTEYKVLRTMGIFFESFEASAELGYGMGGGYKFLKICEIGGSMKHAARLEMSGHSGFDIGLYTGEGGSFSIWDIEIAQVGANVGFFTSAITGETEARCNFLSDRSIGLYKEFYFISGFSVGAGFNYGYFYDETKKVW